MASLPQVERKEWCPPLPDVVWSEASQLLQLITGRRRDPRIALRWREITGRGSGWLARREGGRRVAHQQEEAEEEEDDDGMRPLLLLAVVVRQATR